MKYFKNLSVILILVFSSNVFSDSGVENTTTYIPPENMNSSSGGSGSAGQSDAAKAQQILGAGMNAAQGAMLQKQCNECQGKCNWACAMAAQSFAQALMMAASAMDSGETGDSSRGATCYGPQCESTIDFKGTDLDGTPVDSSGNPLPSAGFTASSIPPETWPYNPETGILSTPEGDVYIDPDASPAQIAAALGGSPSDMKMAESVAMRLGEEALKQLEKEGTTKATVSGMGFESNGGGSSYGSSGSSSGGINLSDFMPRGFGRNPAAVNGAKFKLGKSRILNGEEIGIKMDNIFTMVHRRYQAKRKTNSFLETIINNKKK